MPLFGRDKPDQPETTHVKAAIVAMKGGTLRTHMKQCFQVLPDKNLNIDIICIITNHFKYPSKELLQAWAKNGAVLSTIWYQDNQKIDPGEVCASVIRNLLQNHTKQDVMNTPFFVIPGHGLPTGHEAYFVVAGDLRNPPSNAQKSQWTGQ